MRTKWRARETDGVRVLGSMRKCTEENQERDLTGGSAPIYTFAVSFYRSQLGCGTIVAHNRLIDFGDVTLSMTVTTTSQKTYQKVMKQKIKEVKSKERTSEDSTK